MLCYVMFTEARRGGRGPRQGAPGETPGGELQGGEELDAQAGGTGEPAAQADGMAEGQRRRGRDRDAEEDRGPAADGAATEEEDGRRRVSDSATTILLPSNAYTNYSYYLQPPTKPKSSRAVSMWGPPRPGRGCDGL